MRKLMICRGLIFGAVLWAQVFPNLNNQVAEIRVTEMSQSDDRLKVTFQNVSSRTIRGLSIVLGRHKADPDWSALASGGLAPNATASVTISTAGLHSGGTRRRASPAATLDVLAAVFTDGSPAAAVASSTAAAPEPIKRPVAVALPAKPAIPAVVAGNSTPSAAPASKAPTETASAPSPAKRPAAELSSVPAAPPAKTAALRKPDAPILVPQRALPMNEPVVAVTEHPASPATPPGTNEQGSKNELAKLISLVEVYEPELASAFPRQALRQMVAAVVKEQNTLAAKPDATAFDHGQRSVLQTFAYGIQLIKDRPDLDDDMLRVQVARFLKNQRQSLAKR